AAPVSIDRISRRFPVRCRSGPAFVLDRSGCRPSRERATARQSAGEPTHRRLQVSCARRLGNAVYPAALLWCRGEREPELLLQGSGEKTAHSVPLPPHCARNFVDGGALGPTQHRDDLILL